MNARETRQRALEELLNQGGFNVLAPPVVEAAVRHCEDTVRTGDVDAALDLASRIVGRRDALSAEQELRLHAARATALAIGWKYIQALELVKLVRKEMAEALRAAPEPADRLTVLEGMCLYMLNQAEDSLRTLMELRSRLLKGPDTAVLAFCTNQLSAVYASDGKFELAAQMALDAVVSARRSGDEYVIGQTLTNYSQIQKRACRWAEARAAGEEALSIQEALGARHQVNHIMRSLALLRWKRGELSAALDMWAQCAASAKDLSNVVLASFTDLTKALILIHLGQFEEAQSICRNVPGWEVLHGGSKAALLAAEYLGEIELERGRAASALRLFEELRTRTVAVSPRGDLTAELNRRLAECHYLLARHDAAYSASIEGVELCRRTGDRYEEAATYRILALSAAAIGKPDEAKKWFDVGFAFYEDIQTPYEWGKLWMAYGDWLLGPNAGVHAGAN